MSEWTDQELESRLYRAGNLRHLCQPHQLEVYDAVEQWHRERRDPANRTLWRQKGAYFYDLMVWEWARRVGKTALALILAVQECIRRPNCRGLLFTAKYKNILSIYVPLAREIFAGAPEGYAPVFATASKGDICGFTIPATDSFIKLVGVDQDPDGLRGPFLDFAIGTEACFTKGLEYLITSVLNQQFQNRPWAWSLLESSTAIENDCDYNRVFREDAMLRGAYILKTIRDNTTLTEDEIQDEIARSGGPNSSATLRELFCIAARDEKTLVVPEFREDIHVCDPQMFPVPANALAYVGMDPGMSDMCGIVWYYVDFERQLIIVQAAFAERNQGTQQIAKVIRDTEHQLWGSKHKAPAALPAPLTTMMDLMKPTPQVEEAPADDLLGIDAASLHPSGRVLSQPSGSLVWWDDSMQTLRPNPYKRTSDIDLRLTQDLRQDHNLVFDPAKKGPGSRDANLGHLRKLFSDRKIVILKNGKTEPLIAQLRSGTWNDKGTEWKSTPTLGHLDAISALMYSVRFADTRKNPFKPGHDPRAFDVVVESKEYRKRLTQIFPKRRFGAQPSGGKFTSDRTKGWR